MTRRILVNRIVVTIADCSERGHQPGGPDLVRERLRRELDSVVGLHDPASGRLAILDRQVESLDNEIRVLRFVDRPAHDFPGEGIHHGATKPFLPSLGFQQSWDFP